jgi:UDP-N-acetylmuramoyl-L-alanyl-D-glutamate--2,6-diaminopimelate ligase
MNLSKWTLGSLLAPYLLEPAPDLPIKSLSLNSQNISPGDVFFALLGTKQDGRYFIEAAIRQGAVAIVTELCAPLGGVLDCPAPVVYIPGLAKKISHIAARFYGEPSHDLNIIGVTGTNGKTSCTQFISQALNASARSCASIGTLGVFGLDTTVKSAGLTTPDPILVQKLLAEARASGNNFVAMEVSSHALDQARVAGIRFSTAVFTNLSRDHLDYHGSMTAYGYAKQGLFEFKDLKHAVLNFDDPFSEQLEKVLHKQVSLIRYGFNSNRDLDLRGSALRESQNGISFELTSPWGNATINSKLMGAFNANNLLAVLATLCLEGLGFEEACERIKNVSAVVGRMQAFGANDPELPLVIVDYAHTPDALKQVLKALKQHCAGKLWCVFGCGGDRDKGKRALMGQVAREYADRLVITSDNPRTEDPKDIARDILAGIKIIDGVEVELDRAIAIQYAINQATPADIILIAGKGHESVQIIGEERRPFSDSAFVETVLHEVAHAIV